MSRPRLTRRTDIYSFLSSLALCSYPSARFTVLSLPLRSSTDSPTNEHSPPPQPRWWSSEAETEFKILGSPLVDGNIIRPSLVYGRNGSCWADLFDRATKAGEKGEKFEWVVKEGGRFTLAHVDVSCVRSPTSLPEINAEPCVPWQRRT